MQHAAAQVIDAAPRRAELALQRVLICHLARHARPSVTWATIAGAGLRIVAENGRAFVLRLDCSGHPSVRFSGHSPLCVEDAAAAYSAEPTGKEEATPPGQDAVAIVSGLDAALRQLEAWRVLKPPSPRATLSGGLGQRAAGLRA